MRGKLCLEAIHYEGKRVVFAEAQRALKSQKHSELRDVEFISGRVKRAIECPSFVYEDLAFPKVRRAHYIEEFMINSRYRYTKVVLEEEKDYFSVITAYRPDYVKERGKTKLLYGKDNGKK